MVFHSFVVSALGHRAKMEKHDSAKLTREAVGFFTSLLDRHGSQFQALIPIRGIGNLDLQWSSDHFSCAMATFSSEGELLATDVIVSGMNPEADRKALRMCQTALTNVCSAAGERAPAEDLLKIAERPAAASIRWSSENRKTMDMLADMEICLAAAFLDRSFKAGEFAE